MKHLLILLCTVLTVSSASHRVVVAEEFTATWCTYCPGAARALEENYNRDYDTLVVIAYHSSTSDPFYSAKAASRASYYSLSGYPSCWFDGIISEVGGLHYGTMYPFYRHHVTNRSAIANLLDINLTCTYDSVSNQGTINATIINTSSGSISGTLHFVIIEDNIPYSWQGMSKLDFLMRDMLPDANGEAVTIPAGNNITRSRNFTINSGWNEKNCKIVVFVQASNKEIYQGAEIDLLNQINMDYFGLTFTETSGNGNRVAQPGEAIRAYIMGKNQGSGNYTGTSNISTSDPYITINSSLPQTINISAGDVDTVLIVNFTISASCPSPHAAQFLLNFGTPGDTNRINFIITNQPGFSDNFESGSGNWSHSGTNDNWHITTHKSNSPTHSWYCGVENTWQYTNENDASLVSQYFVATPDSNLKFWHQYATEPSWDYCYIDLDNGSNIWRMLGEFNGTQSNWVQVSYPLTTYAGQTIRIRFRFISDNSTVAEGWYVDDVMVPSMIGINETEKNSVKQTLNVSIKPNIGIAKSGINFIVSGIARPVTLQIYDANGRLVKNCRMFNKNQFVWHGEDDFGRPVTNGVYFVQLDDGLRSTGGKLILIK